MSTVQRHSVIWITCPTCGAKGPGPDFIVRDWNGATYGFRCGHEHHLDPSKGGAESRLVQPSAEDGGKPSEGKAA